MADAIWNPATPVEPKALASSIAVLEAWDARADGEPLTQDESESLSLALHELKRLIAATPSPPVAAATPVLTDEQIGAICDQFKTLIRQKREVHLRRGLDAGADYYIGDVANYVGHAVKEAANARIAELAAENEMLSRSLDESLFCNVQGIAETLATQPQPQPAQPLTDAQEEALRLLFKDAMDWGRSYGQSLSMSDITIQDVSQGFADLAKRAITAPSTPTPPEVAL